jgi:inositol hexakisphosphate/diphosphoinositol-pentakisphosphate kinase
VILNSPIEEWPKVEVLICFYSSGFPMEKGLKYVNTYKPIQINDLEAQKVLWDRRRIYETLVENNIPTAKHFLVERKSQVPID